MPKNQNPLTGKSGLSTNLILTVVVIIVAVVVIGGVLLFNRDGNGGGDGGRTVAAEVLRKPDSHVLTEAPDGRVTVVEFLDFQCPACHKYYQALTKQAEQDYAGRITFVARNFPLPGHPLAQHAARAAEAAAQQGKFNEMYHALYDNYESWALSPDGQNVSDDVPGATAKFEQFAGQIGLDVARFKQDVNSPQVQARIDADIADGKAAGVSGTPTFFINGTQFEPSVRTFEEFSTAFRQKLDQELGR